MLPILFKHAKNFIVSKSEAKVRPQFGGVFFDGEYAFCTDTHVLVAVPFKSEKTILDVRTGKTIDIEGTIIDKWKHVIPESLPLNMKIEKSYLPSLVNDLKVAYKAVNNIPYHVVEFYSKGIIAGSPEGVEISFHHSGDDFPIGTEIDCKILLDVFKFFNDLPNSPDTPEKVEVSTGINSNVIKISYREAVVAIAKLGVE